MIATIVAAMTARMQKMEHDKKKKSERAGVEKAKRKAMEMEKLKKMEESKKRNKNVSRGVGKYMGKASIPDNLNVDNF